MTIEIATFTDEQLFNAYLAGRDAPRLTMAHGVYPNALKALGEYEALVARMAPGGDLESFGEYHLAVTANVQPYIVMLQQAMGAIVQIMQAIETAAPNTFGIQLPGNEQTE
jgi:hypothetical protein